MENLLEVRNLRTEFHTDDGIIEAVKGVSFSVRLGETVGIVGESGSGKSVTSLSVMRLISKPGIIAGGEIFFHHHQQQINLLKLSNDELRRFRGNHLAMIFQEPMTSLNPVFTCGSQITETLIIHKNLSKTEARRQTIALFERVKLPRPQQIFDSYPHQLSGGQKQRVMIAMAISCNPSLLIADEPTTALDVTVQKTILELLHELQQQYRMGMIFITHDLGVIAEIADRVVVMYKGSVVEEGSVKDIFENPQHPYTKGLLACRPPLDKKLKRLPVIADFMNEEVQSSKFKVQKGGNAEPVLNGLVVTEAETKQHRAKLYAQQPILKVKNMKVHFPVKKGVFGKTKHYVRAVDDVSFEVYPGETLGLVGESGCGKTTLGRSIIRLIEPTGGQVIFKGVDFAGLEAGAQLQSMRKNIQIIFQDPYSSLNPRLTIGEAIAEPMKVHGVQSSKFKVQSSNPSTSSGHRFKVQNWGIPHLAVSSYEKQVKELLEQVGLPDDYYHRYPHELSGGQRQRVCIARALSLQPEFIICDESVSALDVSVQAQVLNLLNDLKKDFGFTYIFISHDLSVVKFMSDRIAVMNKGRIEELGPSEEIYHSPKSEYTKRLIEAIPKGGD